MLPSGVIFSACGNWGIVPIVEGSFNRGSEFKEKEGQDVKLKAKASKLWLGVLVAAMVAMLLAGSACGGGDSEDGDEEPVTTTVAVADELDDGTIAIAVEGLPYMMGSLYGGVDPLSNNVVPGAALWQGAQIRLRGLYRFNIAAWSEGDLSFHNECVTLYGDAGDLEVYVLEDFGSLPAEQAETSGDVSGTWDAGELVGTVTPVGGEWFEVDVPEAQVAEYKSDGGYIAFMLKATGETTPASTLMTPNACALSSYEYATSTGNDTPYVEWTV